MRIKGQADIDISINDNGYILLTQVMDGERKIVEFAPAYGAKIAEAIASLIDFAQVKFQKAVPVED
jgi:hypothetical protein